MTSLYISQKFKTVNQNDLMFVDECRVAYTTKDCTWHSGGFYTSSTKNHLLLKTFNGKMILVQLSDINQIYVKDFKLKQILQKL